VDSGIYWSVRDRYGNEVYLTHERRDHITELHNHPEMNGYEEELRRTIQRGSRRQDPRNPQKYQYIHTFSELYVDNTHIVAIVLFRFREGENGEPVPNNYVVTAYQKEIG
jgi:hypothetical protein